MGRKLYVGNLSFSIDSAGLERLFSEYGKVESASVVTDRESGRSRGSNSFQRTFWDLFRTDPDDRPEQQFYPTEPTNSGRTAARRSLRFRRARNSPA